MAESTCEVRVKDALTEKRLVEEIIRTEHAIAESEKHIQKSLALPAAGLSQLMRDRARLTEMRAYLAGLKFLAAHVA